MNWRNKTTRPIRSAWGSALAPALALAIGALATAPPALAAQADSSDPWVVPERRAARANPLEPTPDVIAHGRELYEQQCEFCHGSSGDNDGAAAPAEIANARRLSDPALNEESDGALFWKIGEGRNPMPSTWDMLEDQDRWSIVLYLRTLSAQGDPGDAAGT